VIIKLPSANRPGVKAKLSYYLMVGMLKLQVSSSANIDVLMEGQFKTTVLAWVQQKSGRGVTITKSYRG
jgi:hypothetical protein